MEEKQNAALGTAPLGKLMVKFALPCTISLLVGALYNIVDQIFIGWGVGYLGNGATNVVFPLTVLALGLAVMIGDGACSYVSICFGKNRQEDADCAVGSAVTLSVSVGVLVAGFYAVFQTPILLLFGATEANLAYAKEYFTYITIGIPIYVFGQAINPIIRSDGSPRFAMASMLAGAIANCILDPIAIFVLRWGVMGAAVATVAGQVITAAMGVWYLCHTKALRLGKDDFKLRGKILAAYLPLGLCSFLAQISLVIAMAATNNMLVQYGAGSKYGADIPLTVLGIVMKVFQIIISITIGMSAGCIPIVGYNYGAGNSERVKKTFKLLLAVCLTYSFLLWGFIELFPQGFARMFSSDAALIDFTAHALRIYCAVLCLFGIQMSCQMAFVSIGSALCSISVAVVRKFVLLLPLIYIMPAFVVDKTMGVYMAEPVADVIAITFTSILFTIQFGKAMKKL